MEVDVILKDHSYARPWNWKPENVYVKPIKKLFFNKKNVSVEKQGEDEEINVVDDVNTTLNPPVDLSRSKHLMEELQRLATFARPEGNDEWEEEIDKMLWSPVQHRIFNKVIKILNSERLSRLAKANSQLEPIFRRTSVDTAARRFREALASAGWDWRVAQWLHSLLFDHLPPEYLGLYLDILQTLRLKIPQLIDKMIAVQPNIISKGVSVTWETLGSLLKRSWDPITPSMGSNRLKKLPGNPILIIAPSGIGSSTSSRQNKWTSQLGALGTVVTVHSHLGLAANRVTMMVCIDQLVQATRAKIQDIRSDCPGRPIILVGFNTGAALACQVAQMEHVTAVICLGFPFSTAEGKRGTPDDTLMDIRCPVMFVIGQNATLVRPDDLEDLREKMLVETSLVVVGTADDNLRVSTAKKLSEGITQSIVDRRILDEIGDFVGSILLHPHPLPLRTTAASNYENKNSRKDQRKRKNSTSSSVESEPNSPTVKKSRPNTPVSSAASHAANMAAAVSKIGTFNTQASLVPTSGSQGNHVSTVKRKPRPNQKAQLVEHIISTKMTASQNSSSENGGITLNIGSLASLSPIGPIRLAPTSAGQNSLTMTKTSPKTSITTSKVSKIVSANVPLQNVPKMKAIVSTNKGYSKVMSCNYRHTNTSENNDNKLVTNFPVTNQIRTNTTASTTTHNKSLANSSGIALTSHTQNGKSSLPSGSPSHHAQSSSSILLTPSSSVESSITTITPTTSKVTDVMPATSSTSYAMHNSSFSFDTSKMSELSRQVTVCNKNDNLYNTTSGNIVMIDSTSITRSASSSVVVPINNRNSGTVQPLSNKSKSTHKSVKTMPKITVNTSNFQRLQKAKPPQTTIKKPFINDIDDDLGNILDIPIIFAKDDENINNIEKNPSLSHVTVSMDATEKTPAKLTPNTKVVLISNKQDKLQQSNKIVVPTTQAIICPNMSMQNLNHVILQTRSQNPTVATKTRPGIALQGRLNQPTIKYTKIILAKRNSHASHQNDKTEPVIVTKTIDRVNTPQLLNFEKNEHRYAQLPPKLLIKDENKFVDETLEIEDAIKSTVIERTSASTTEIGMTTPMKSDSSKNLPGKTVLNVPEEDNTQSMSVADDTNDL